MKVYIVWCGDGYEDKIETIFTTAKAAKNFTEKQNATKEIYEDDFRVEETEVNEGLEAKWKTNAICCSCIRFGGDMQLVKDDQYACEKCFARIQAGEVIE